MKTQFAALALISLACPAAALAVGVGNEALLAPVTVTGAQEGLAPDLPNTTASKTETQLAAQNIVNPEDVLRYMPNTTIRKRYIGDRNALIGGRNFGTLQPQRALVYVDDTLISNFLGRFDAPRWNMVTPEAIERVDVLYGPYSALYPGNSIGTTVVLKEKAPDGFEGSARLTGHTQAFKAYGYSERFGGGQLSGYLGNRFDSGLWAALTLNHQDTTSQPMQYFTKAVTPGTAGTRVTGIAYDRDPLNVPRAVFGANSGAIDHTLQDTAKLKLGMEIVPHVEVSGLIGGWRNDTTNRNRSFLRDAATGAPVWTGTVTDGVNSFNLGTNAFVPSTRDETHRQLGATLKTTFPSGWNGSVIVTDYAIVKDINPIASQSEPLSLSGGPGQVVYRDGTGWTTFEVQALYQPRNDDFGRGRHTLTFGYHHNDYALDTRTDNVGNWLNPASVTSLDQHYQGRTLIQAVYAQDVVQLAPNWKLTAGLRYERFESSDGKQTVRVTNPCTAPTNSGLTATCTNNGDGTSNIDVTYDGRRLSGLSPKLSLAWTARDDLLIRASYGRGVRFPNVDELFNGTRTSNTVTVNDPKLKAERSDAFELAGEWFVGDDTVRVSGFYDEVADAIYRQVDLSVTPSVTRVNSVDLQRTYGIEFAWSALNLGGVNGLALEASMAWTSSKVAENSRNPQTEGKYWLRVPKTRGNVLLSYAFAPQWKGSLGYRHEGRSYARDDNLDVNSDTFGAVSRVDQLDARLTCKPTRHIDLSFGVDNLTNQQAFQYHPYPQRTFFVELKGKL